MLLEDAKIKENSKITIRYIKPDQNVLDESTIEFKKEGEAFIHCECLCFKEEENLLYLIPLRLVVDVDISKK